MDTDGGGWTLMLTLMHPNNQYVGTQHPMTQDLNLTTPDPASAYSRDWRGIFTPGAGTEMMTHRGVGGDWVRFVVISFCGWDSTSAGVCAGPHGTYASGAVWDSTGTLIDDTDTWMNSCSQAGGCAAQGCDSFGFNSNHGDYAANYNGAMELWGSGWEGSECYGSWGQETTQTDVFPSAFYIRQ